MLRWTTTRSVMIALALVVAGIVSIDLTAVDPRAHADALSFNFKDPKGVNTLSFVLDSPLEPIMGVAQGISGTVKFDPAAPKATTGVIVVQAKSVTVPNERMTMKLHGVQWLDVEAHPEIRFALKSVKKSTKTKNGFDLHMVGELTLHGVSKEIDVVVDVRHLVDGLGKRMPGGKKGDLLVLRSRFTINRSEFKVGASMPAVAEKIEIRLAMVGMAPR